MNSLQGVKFLLFQQCSPFSSFLGKMSCLSSFFLSISALPIKMHFLRQFFQKILSHALLGIISFHDKLFFITLIQKFFSLALFSIHYFNISLLMYCIIVNHLAYPFYI